MSIALFKNRNDVTYIRSHEAVWVDADLPERYARNRPGHAEIPAVFVSMIGVDSRYQGQGYDRDLLMDCRARVAEVEKTIGLPLVPLDVLDCREADAVARRRAFYASFGFIALQANPLRMILPTAQVRGLFDDAAGLI